jgi:hypothetical protein
MILMELMVPSFAKFAEIVEGEVRRIPVWDVE